MRVLFICTQNRLRSPTAEAVFSRWEGVECESAGTADSANVPLDSELLAWAEAIFVMEKQHRDRLSRRWKRYLGDKRVVCLDIPDDYDYMDPPLIRVLERKVAPYLMARGARPPQGA